AEDGRGQRGLRRRRPAGGARGERRLPGEPGALVEGVAGELEAFGERGGVVGQGREHLDGEAFRARFLRGCPGAAAERGGQQQRGDDRRAHVEQPGTGAADACGTIGHMTLLLTLDDGSVQRKLADAVEFARAAVLEDAPEEQLGAHVGVTREDAVTASHLFEAQVPGYGGWRWSVTVALA